MTKYVVGFMFSNDRQFVVLIRKNRPEWQAGKLNGIGGKIEDGETPRGAMVREFFEETGVQTSEKDWNMKGRIEGREFRVFILYTFSNQVFDIQSVTDEKVHLWCSDPVPDDVISNLRSIIPALLLPNLDGIYLTYFGSGE